METARRLKQGKVGIVTADSLNKKNVKEILGKLNGGALIIGTKYDLNPFEKDVLFLFCGSRGDRIRGLLWEGNGFLLLYKRLEDGSFSWPRNPQEAAELTREQYKMLLMGLNPLNPKIKDVNPQKIF